MSKRRRTDVYDGVFEILADEVDVKTESLKFSANGKRLLTVDDIASLPGAAYTIGVVSTVPNQNGVSIDGNTITLHAADENNPGILVDQDQIIPSGIKQFNDVVAATNGFVCGDLINGDYKGELTSDALGMRLSAPNMRINLDVNGPNGLILNLGPSHHPYGIYFSAYPIFNGPQSIHLRPLHPGNYTGNYTIDVLPKNGTMMVEDEVTLGPFVMTLNIGAITASKLRGVNQVIPGTMDGVKLKRAGSIIWCQIPAWEVTNNSVGGENTVVIVPSGSIPTDFRPFFQVEIPTCIYSGGVIQYPTVTLRVTTDGEISIIYMGHTESGFSLNYGMIDGDFTFSYML